MPIQPRIPPASVTLYSPGVCIHNTEEESRYFRVFSEHSAFELSGFFDTDFWNRVVLQESHRNVPIRHAVMAIGALNKSLEAAPSPDLKVNVLQTLNKKHYESAVLNYVKSIQALNQYISSSDSPQLRIVLISCLLFICFETFVGSFASSVQQTYGGLKILKSYYVGKPGSKPWIPLKPSTKTVRNKKSEISKALQIRPGCDSVSKDVTMTKHLEEYLDTEFDTEDRADTGAQSQIIPNESCGDDLHTEQVGIPPTKFTGNNSHMEQQQQTLMSVASEERSLYVQDSRQMPERNKLPSASQVLSNADVHEQNGYLSRNLSTVKGSHSTSSVSTPATYTTPSTSGTTSPGNAPNSQPVSISLNRSVVSSSRGETPNSPRILQNDNPIEDSLIQAFVRLDGQGMFFGMAPGIPPLIWDIHEKHHFPIPPMFTHFATAHRCWDFLMDRCLQFYRRTLFHRAYSPHNQAPESETRRQYASYIRQLSSFASAYKPLLDSAISPVGEIRHPSALILSIYHKTTTITLAAVTSDSEMVYDAFLADFKYITEICALLIASQSVGGPRNPRFSFDVGVVPPLHVTATKCRDPSIRRRAVELLFASPRQEGLWDGVLTARIGKWITNCEEDGLSVPPYEPSNSQNESQEDLGAHESYPSPASADEYGGYRENGELLSRSLPGAINEYVSAKDGGALEHGSGLRFPNWFGMTNKRDKTGHKGRANETRHWMVPEENRVQLTVVDFHITERYIKVKCQKALVGEDGTREQRETVIAW